MYWPDFACSYTVVSDADSRAGDGLLRVTPDVLSSPLTHFLNLVMDLLCVGRYPSDCPEANSRYKSHESSKLS